MTEHRTVRVWRPVWWDRLDENPPMVKCGPWAEHSEDSWFMDCEHTPTVRDFVQSARAQVDELGKDQDVLEVISNVYFDVWVLHRRQGAEHVEQWPLALVVLAGLREAGYEVVKKDA